MSYILDALRRAEAQRQQQAATPPGLGSPALPVAQGNPPAAGEAAASVGPGARSDKSQPPPPSQTPVGTGWMPGIAGAAVVALVALGVVGQRTTETPVAAPPSVPAGTPPAASTSMVPAKPPVPAAEPARILQPAPEPVAVAAPEPSPAQTRQTAPAKPAGDASPQAGAAPRYADLPESVRASLPAISVQGVTWSENPALRHLIVNGRVLQEGQSIGPDHVLEQIGRDSSVLKHRGQRYRIGH